MGTQFLKKNCPDSKSDLFAAFMERCTDLAVPGGAVAMITMQSWMFLSSYEKLRKSLLEKQHISSMLHLGARAFDSIGGEVVSSTAFVLTNQRAESLREDSARRGAYIRLVDGSSEQEKIASLNIALSERTSEGDFYLASSSDFSMVPGSPIVYWLSEKTRAAFSEGHPLKQFAAAQLGMRTGNNEKYLRQWWEVSNDATVFEAGSADEADQPDHRWVPYNKGGSFRKWSGNREYVVFWENNGFAIKEETLRKYPQLSWDNLGWKISNEDSFFRPSVSWSKVSSGAPAFREYDRGFIFDVAGTSFFPKDSIDRRVMMGVCNSSTALTFLQALSPTMNFEVGQVAVIPIVLPSEEGGVRRIVDQLVQTASRDWDSDESSWGFMGNPLITRRSEG